MTESKTAGCEAATPAVESSKETNQTVAIFQLREARSKQNFWDEFMVVIFFVPPFLILDNSALILSG